MHCSFHGRPPPPMSPAPLPRLRICLVVAALLAASAAQAVDPGDCGGTDRCGDLVIPFPFHLNSSCNGSAGTNSSSFRLSCDANATLTLPLGSTTFRVLGFQPSGSLLLDYAPASPSACDAAYAAFARPTSPAAALDAAPFLAVTPANVLRLYACEDSSLCRAGCDDVVATCGARAAGKAGCCYPLSDGSVWKPGNGLGVFADFGCRGFSSWVKNRTAAGGFLRGIEAEWAVPRDSAVARCADGAALVNATAVHDGVRCVCPAGLDGDGFALGTGCSKGTRSCSSDGQASDGRDCCQGRFCSKRAIALAGFFVSLFFVAAAVSFWLFLRQPSKDSRWDLDPACIPKILRSACDAREFTYEQLEEATRRFDGDKAVDTTADDGAVYAGVLDDGSVVAMQRISYETQGKLWLVLDRIELLSEVAHPNIARVVGFCLDLSGRALLLVHEHFAGGTLEDHLRHMKGRVLSWYHRVNIAIELASALTYLQARDTAPTFLPDLRSGDIFLDSDFTAKIAGYKLTRAAAYYCVSYDQDVVCNFGHLLIELLTGLRQQMPFDSVAPKVREGRLHEVIDPTLLSGKQLPASQDEVRKVFELAVRCLSSAENGLCMLPVAKELMHILRDNNGSSSKIEISLEETFSSSSLLQMISMSPDTLLHQLP